VVLFILIMIINASAHLILRNAERS